MTGEVGCPVCFCKTRNEIFNATKELTIYSCSDCFLKFIYPVPSEKKLVKLYGAGYFEGGIGDIGGYRNYLELEEDLKKEAEKKLYLIRKFAKKGKLLDVGAGVGIFAKEAKKAGFKVFANDISAYTAGFYKNLKIKFYHGAIKQGVFPKNHFDIVTAWDVIEHMANVNDMMNAVSVALKKGGYFFLTTPDTGSWDARLLAKNWYGYKKLPEHLLFFNRSSITRLLKRYGFEIVFIKQWGFQRSVGFLFEKISNYGTFFKFFRKLGNMPVIKNLSLFFPMTDFLVVAKKKS